MGQVLHGSATTTEALIFFITRYWKPREALETGVAAGHSSRAILKAMEINGEGHLWSSDFPLFRLENPEKHIGFMVESELRDKWSFEIKGDRANIPVLLKQMTRVDFFHYDSDKTTAGRKFACEQIRQKLSDRTVIMFDDINDNLHFKELVEAFPDRFHVFPFKSKWVGVIVPEAKVGVDA